MLLGDGPLIQEPKSSDLLVAADATTHKGRTVLISKLFELFRGWLKTATQTAAGLMTPEDKQKVDSLQTASEIEAINTDARTEHAQLVVRQASNGTVRMFYNLRNPGKIIRAYAETEVGTFTLTLKIDGKAVTGVSNLGVTDQGTGMLSITENNTFGSLSLVEAVFSNASSPVPGNVTVGLLLRYDKPE